MLAEEYFEIFHQGDLSNALLYMSEDCLVSYGDEEPKALIEFISKASEIVRGFDFVVNGVYTSSKDSRVMIFFSYSVSDDMRRKSKMVEAIDIIDFDQDQRIKKIQIIPNT